MARYALERIPDNSAINALRKALPLSSPSVRAGIITSLGVRRDARSVPVIGAYIHDGSEQVATAALQALAAIGTQQAAEILLAAADMKEGALKQCARDGYLQCGYSLLENSNKRHAATVFNTPYKRFAEDTLMRAAALRGRIAVAGDRACDVIMEVLQGDEPDMSDIAATAVRDITDPETLSKVASVVPELSPRSQVLLITALSESGAAGVTSHLMTCAKSEDESVRLAALQALATIGDASATPFLMERAVSTTGKEQETARFALSRLHCATPILLETLQTGAVEVRNEAIKAVAARHLSEATPVLLDLLAKEDGIDKAGLLQTLVEVAGTEHLDSILPLLLQAGEGKDSASLLDVVASAAKRSDGDGTSWEPLAEALKTEQNPQARRNLYAALGKIADAQTLPLFQQGFSESDPAVRLAVMEALGAWPDATSMELLKQAAEQFKGTAEGSAAIAGYLRLAGLDEKRDVNETAALYQAMLPLAASAEDKQACIAALGKTGSDAALPVLYEALNSEDEALKTASLRALGAWPNAAPMSRLETLAKEGPDSLRLEALRGYFRLIGINREISGEEAVARYKEALALAPNAAEKKRILSGLANAQNLGALLVAAECLNDPELKDEAEVAAVKIAAQVVGSHPSQVRPILEQVEAASQSAYVKDEIGKLYQQIERFEDYITAWEVSGPYTLEEGGMKKLFNTAFPPEQEEAGIEWRLIPVGTHAEMPFLVELEKVMEGDNRAAYLRTYVWSDAARDAVLELGSDDGNKAWVNGKLVHENNIVRPAAPAQDSAPVYLNEGWNTLLIKVTQGGGQWSLCARLRHPEGLKLEGIRISVQKN
jgi:HEAT repeat protein